MPGLISSILHVLTHLVFTSTLSYSKERLHSWKWQVLDSNPSTSVFPYPKGICSKTSSGRLKPRRVLNPIYTMCFPHTYTTIIKFHL